MSRNILFCDRNDLTASSDFSSEESSFPFTNALTNNRSQYWLPQGNFTLTTSNNLLYINDGSDKTVTMTVGNYATGTLLATQIQTQLNASSSGWTVTYNTSTYLFTLTCSSVATLRWSVTTNSIAETIGFVVTIDAFDPVTSDEARRHSHEFIDLDLVSRRAVDFAGLLGISGESFSLSSDATIKLQGSNINDFVNPDYEVEGVVDGTGGFVIADGSTYRYWRLHIEDKRNTNTFKWAFVYMGRATETTRNISNGFQATKIDPTEKVEVEDGSFYFYQRKSYHTFGNISMRHLTKEDRQALQDTFNIVGIQRPFFIVIDPDRCISSNEFIKLVRFSAAPTFTHLRDQRFETQVSLIEVL
jgi:hypothetical protein